MSSTLQMADHRLNRIALPQQAFEMRCHTALFCAISTCVTELQRKMDIKRALEPLKVPNSIPDAHFAFPNTESTPATA